MYECAHSFITYNNLNIPSYDVHSVEARDQMLVNLYKLQQSFVKINNTITEKTKQQNQRIQKIRQRIGNCMRRIQQVEGINKAICFVSPGQYPAKYKFDPEKNVSIFKDFIQRTKVNKFDLQAHYQMKHQIQKVGQASKLELDNLYKFVLYLYGKLKCKKMSTFESSIAQKKIDANNLGRIPNTIRYVDSLTVFDTYINPYKNYELASKPKVTKTNKKKQKEVVQQIISITTYTKPSYQMEKPDYKPATQQIDDIKLDDDLSLQGVVDIDIDDFLSGMSMISGIVEKKVVEDPYKRGGNATYQNQSNNNQYNQQSSINSTSYSNQSSSLPPPPPSLNMTLPPPPSLSSLNIPTNLPPPPLLNLSLPPPPGGLPPPPALNFSLPPPPGGLPPPPALNLSLPPPPGGLPPPPSLGLPAAPSLGLPPPISSNPAPPASEGDRSGLLRQLNSPNPMSRLKKTVTKQTPTVIKLNQTSASQPTTDSNGQARPLSHAQALRLKIMNRFKALHPDRQSDED